MADHDDRGERSAPTTEGVRILGAQEAAEIEAERRGDEPRTVQERFDELVEEDATEALPVASHERPDTNAPRGASAASGGGDAPEPTWAEVTNEGPTWSASSQPDDVVVAERGVDDALEGPSWLEPDYEPDAAVADTPRGASAASGGSNAPGGASAASGGSNAPGGASAASGGSDELPHWSEPPTGQVPVVGAEDAPGSPRYRGAGDDWSDADVAALSDSSDDDSRLGAMEGREPETHDDDATFVAAVRAKRRSGTRAVVTSTPDPRPPARTSARRSATAATGAATAGDVLPKAGGRDLPVALATAVVFAAVALVCFSLGQVATGLLAALVIAVCVFELCAILQAKGLRPATLPVVVACAAAPLVALKGEDVTSRAGAAAGLGTFTTLFALVTIVSFVWFLWRVGPGRPVVGVAISLLVFCYIGGLGGYAGLLLQRGPNGVGLLIGTLLVVIAYDAVGYFAGSRLGSAPIAPNTSPGKTVEGTLAGVVASLLVAVIILPQFAPWENEKLLVMAALGLLLGVSALVGDLCESMLKRDLGVKDFGTLLPGHGGFLDRFDGLLFALPVAYYVTLHLKLF